MGRHLTISVRANTNVSMVTDRLGNSYINVVTLEREEQTLLSYRASRTVTFEL